MAWKHFGPSSCGTMVKTEAPGLYGVGQAQGPQAWPGTFLPCHPQLCSIYSRRARLGVGTRPGQQMRSRLKRGRNGGGPANRPRTQGEILGSWGEGPASGLAVPSGSQRKSVVTLRTGGTAASHRGSWRGAQTGTVRMSGSCHPCPVEMQ